MRLRSCVWLGILCWLLWPSGARATSFECVQRDTIVKYRFVPRCEGTGVLSDNSHYQFRTNAEGLKTKDYPPRAAKGVMRLMLLGDSFTTDVGEHGIGAELQRQLEKSVPGRRVEVVNASVPGYNIVQLYLVFPQMMAAYSPRVVMLNSMFSTWWLSVAVDEAEAFEHGPDGLVKQLGYSRDFWPLPASWSSFVWQYLHRPIDSMRLRALLQGMRMLVWKGGFWLRSFYTAPEVLAEEVYETHLKYYRAMKKMTEATGGTFLVANVIDRTLEAQRKYPRSPPFIWYQPDSYANQLKLSIFPDDVVERFTERLRKDFVVVDISDEARFVEKSNDEGFIYDPAHREPVARSLAPHLVPILRGLAKTAIP